MSRFSQAAWNWCVSTWLPAASLTISLIGAMPALTATSVARTQLTPRASSLKNFTEPATTAGIERAGSAPLQSSTSTSAV